MLAGSVALKGLRTAQRPSPTLRPSRANFSTPLAATPASQSGRSLPSKYYRSWPICSTHLSLTRRMTTLRTQAQEQGPLPIIDPSTLPPHFTEDKEREWARKWEESGLYHFDPNSTAPIFCTFKLSRPFCSLPSTTFPSLYRTIPLNHPLLTGTLLEAIDTPPPTASGKLHIGHIFSYSHTDMIARYQRMSGKNVFYPMGWDDNGLPTERRVQNYYHIWCSDSGVPYEPNLKLPVPTDKEKKKLQRRQVSRKNFIELCSEVTRMDEVQFKELFTRLGLSVDWREEYATISHSSRRLAQLSFIDLYRKGYLYQSSSPTLWDIDFQTAIAQAEVEDREEASAFHKVHFGLLNAPKDRFTIATTRPELIPACVAIAAHPEDEKYRHLIGQYAISPIFFAPIPIVASTTVDREKGTGIVMICTFGDVMDVDWWREKRLPLRQIIGRNGRIMDQEFIQYDAAQHASTTHGENAANGTFYSLRPSEANESYSALKGKSLVETRRLIVEKLKLEASSAIFGAPTAPLAEPPTPLVHPVKFFEKGSRPLELIPTKQWFVRLLDKKETLLKQGAKVNWKPEYMVKKYNDWVQGLNADWCISRQRFFGVPFPLFYPINDEGEIIYGMPILPDAAQLPIDPMFDVPNGFQESQRGQPGGFIGEYDVFDTWWTSSLSPQLITGWMADESKHKALYPMDLRPQSHEIIRTWAFYTIVKSLLHEDSIPWKEMAISGWIVDKDGSKISKSAGNATIAPMDLLNKHFSDGVRYWTGSSRLGSDTIFEEPQMAVGRKLVMKLFNAGKLCFSNGPIANDGSDASGLLLDRITNDLDLVLLAQLKRLAAEANSQFAEMNFAKVTRDVEIWFFSRFTDNYLEMIKSRIRDDSDIAARDSAIITLRFAMGIILRLLAPILPHITEEVWSWALSKSTGFTSIHKAPYPTTADFASISRLSSLGEQDSALLAERMDTVVACAEVLRKCKTEASLKFSNEIECLSIKANAKTMREMDGLWKDVLFAVKARRANYETDETLADKAFAVTIV